MTITHHPDLIQGSDEWFELRRGMLTASEMKLIITPTLKIAANDKSRAHLYELLAQRISGYVEPSYVGDDMLRGRDDEILACALYSEKYAPVTPCGFVTNDKWGFTIGCSPDGLIAEDGGVEVKSRLQKFQISTIIDNEMPSDYEIQVQTCMLVTERPWWDFVSYSNGLHMASIRVWADPETQDAIVKAATAFEAKLAEKWAAYTAQIETNSRLIPTERRVVQEMF